MSSQLPSPQKNRLLSEHKAVIWFPRAPHRQTLLSCHLPLSWTFLAGSRVTIKDSLFYTSLKCCVVGRIINWRSGGLNSSLGSLVTALTSDYWVLSKPLHPCSHPNCFICKMVVFTWACCFLVEPWNAKNTWLMPEGLMQRRSNGQDLVPQYSLVLHIGVSKL